MSQQFNYGVYGVEEISVKHRKKKNKKRKNYLIQQKCSFIDNDEWYTVKAYHTKEQRDQAFEQMVLNYTSKIGDLRKEDRKEVSEIV